MSKILILGGSGFIGSNLTELLVNSCEKIIIFDQKNANYNNLNSIANSSKIKIIKGNFNDSTIIEKIFDENEIDIVIHLICSIVPGTPLNLVIDKMELNLNSTMKLLNIMQRKNVNKLVFFSTGGAIYGLNDQNINNENNPTNPINYYGWLKLTIEKYIQMCHNIYGLNYLILRPSNAYGKNQNIYGNQGIIAVTLGNLIQNKKIIIWGNGKIIRDYIYIDDLCKALFFLIKKNKWNNVYNIGSGKGTSVNEILEIIKKITGINFHINYTQSRKIDIATNILDTSKLKRDINWENLINLEEGIKIMWEWTQK